MRRRFRIDVLVEGIIVVELKCAEALLLVHEAQLLFNFNVPHLKEGIIRTRRLR